ncbi:xanthine dehydrogenase small subunit, partial [bacterium]
VDNPSKLTLISGDTDIMVGVNLGKFQPQKIVDLHRIREFTCISRDNGLITIGARATLSDVLDNEEVRRSFPALTEAVRQMCSTPIRNVATLVGNVCTASPIADAIPPLLAYDATVVVQSIKGTRQVPLRDWFKSYRKTALGHDEVIVAIEIPIIDCLASFEKTGKRKTLDIATVNSALAVQVKKGHFETVRLFFGGVAAVPFEAEMTSEFLIGKEAGEAVIYEASRIAAKEISPLSDVRGSLEFRRQLAANHIIKHFTKLMPSLFE